MSFPMTFSYTSVFVFCSCPVSLHSWYVWILSWLLAHFVNGSVSTFRERILSFWFVHVHKHLCAWHSLSVSICWGNAEAVNSWCWWTVCPRKVKQRLITGKVPMNNEASEISSIAFCYILCVGGVWAGCDHSSQASWGVDMYLRSRLWHELNSWEPGTERYAEKHQCPVGGPDPELSSTSFQAPAWFWMGRELC